MDSIPKVPMGRWNKYWYAQPLAPGPKTKKNQNCYAMCYATVTLWINHFVSCVRRSTGLERGIFGMSEDLRERIRDIHGCLRFLKRDQRHLKGQLERNQKLIADFVEELSSLKDELPDSAPPNAGSTGTDKSDNS